MYISSQSHNYLWSAIFLNIRVGTRSGYEVSLMSKINFISESYSGSSRIYFRRNVINPIYLTIYFKYTLKHNFKIFLLLKKLFFLSFPFYLLLYNLSYIFYKYTKYLLILNSIYFLII